VSVVTSPYVTIKSSLRLGAVPMSCRSTILPKSLRGRHPLGNGWFADPLTADDQREIAGVHAGWTMTCRALTTCSSSRGAGCAKNGPLSAPPVSTERYFIPEVVEALRDRETFLDGGAYHGDVSLTFAAKVAGFPSHRR